MPGVTPFLCAGVCGECAHVCVCRCMYMFVDVPACVCTCAQVVVMWVDACAYMHFGGCMALCVCTHPCRGCAHLEKSQGRENSGVLSSGLYLWRHSPTSCSSPAQKQPLLHEWAQCPPLPDIPLVQLAAYQVMLLQHPYSQPGEPLGGCRGRFGDILPGLLLLSPVWVLWPNLVSASSSFLD